MYSIDIKELKKAMIDADLDEIKKLSEVTGINRNTLGDVLNGKIIPSTDVIMRLAKALNLSSARLGEIFFATSLTSDVSN